MRRNPNKEKMSWILLSRKWLLLDNTFKSLNHQFRCQLKNIIKLLISSGTLRWALPLQRDKVCSLLVARRQEECRQEDLARANMVMKVHGVDQDLIAMWEPLKTVRKTSLNRQSPNAWCHWATEPEEEFQVQTRVNLMNNIWQTIQYQTWHKTTGEGNKMCCQPYREVDLVVIWTGPAFCFQRLVQMDLLVHLTSLMPANRKVTLGVKDTITRSSNWNRLVVLDSVAATWTRSSETQSVIMSLAARPEERREEPSVPSWTIAMLA